jgi:hypothetical protein
MLDCALFKTWLWGTLFWFPFSVVSAESLCCSLCSLNGWVPQGSALIHSPHSSLDHMYLITFNTYKYQISVVSLNFGCVSQMTHSPSPLNLLQTKFLCLFTL